MRYYCPGCWNDFAEDLSRCPRCGLDIRGFYESKDYFGKLIQALDHPEQTTPIRAARILAWRRETQAVGALIGLARRTADPYVATAIVKALGEIGTEDALEFLRTLHEHPIKMVREAARRFIEGNDAREKS